MHSVQELYAQCTGLLCTCTRLLCTVYKVDMYSVHGWHGQLWDDMHIEQGWYAVYKVVMHKVQCSYVQCTLYKGGMHSVKGWYVQCTLYTVQD